MSMDEARYLNQKAFLATKHDKARAIARPMRMGIGLEVVTSSAIDTDLLGTFTGEVRRNCSPLDTVLKKARMGMAVSGLPLGLANEGSFGPHPYLFFVPGTQEIMAFIDDHLEIEVTEQLVSAETNFNQALAESSRDLCDFLIRAKFPSHGLIVRPNSEQGNVGVSAADGGLPAADGLVIKGVCSLGELERAIELCKLRSTDGKAFVETDMRAHMNPTRQRVIRRLAVKLARRLMQLCPSCACPGWGVTDFLPGLPCDLCGLATEKPLFEIHSCQKCSHQERLLRRDGQVSVDPRECNYCNP
ncbi:MAG: hypothetical protein Q8T09_00950 [Candidatus Melainabacteria bacterium]|nr:hypothetical protein [Candidatus Melainabacteria bacterium]